MEPLMSGGTGIDLPAASVTVSIGVSDGPGPLTGSWK